MHDLAIIIVSIPDEPYWLGPCLRTVYERAGLLSLQVIVVDNGVDGIGHDALAEFPGVQLVRCENRGFGHGNNRGLEVAEARHVLFLNPDTEIVDGTLAELVEELDRRPEVGVLGVRQVLPGGAVYPSARRFPSALRALGGERSRIGRRLFTDRVLDLPRYDAEFSPDWVIGSFMLVRGEALASAGHFDERFFLYSEETDLCLRIRDVGWDVLHVPSMTIVHHLHAGKAVSPRMEAQRAFAQLQYARKHFGRLHRFAYYAALSLRHGLRAALTRDERRDASLHVLRLLSGRSEPPFGSPPAVEARERGVLRS